MTENVLLKVTEMTDQVVRLKRQILILQDRSPVLMLMCGKVTQ